MQSYSGQGWLGRWESWLLLGLFSLVAVPSCQDLHSPGVLSLPLDPRSSVQEGLVTLKEGEELQVCYKTPYQSSPRLSIEEVKASWSEDHPYRKSDFQVVLQDAAYFKIRNHHTEPWHRSWATLRWRAEGILAEDKPESAAKGPGSSATHQTPQDLLIARIKKAGGSVETDNRSPHPSEVPNSFYLGKEGKVEKASEAPHRTIIAIDLHGTKITDADLEQLAGLTSLRRLNLYGTKVTDAGMKHLSGLIGLQTLYLNDTGITNAGLQQLQPLTNLNELGLSHTGITDQGVLYLKGMVYLHNLSLYGTAVTDQSLAQLKTMKSLKQLSLSRTRVTPEGVAELKKALRYTVILL